MSDRGLTIREAVKLALEPIGGERAEWVASRPQLVALRAHVVGWVHDYARHRGVLLTDDDITGELEAVLAQLARAP